MVIYIYHFCCFLSFTSTFLTSAPLFDLQASLTARSSKAELPAIKAIRCGRNYFFAPFFEHLAQISTLIFYTQNRKTFRPLLAQRRRSPCSCALFIAKKPVFYIFLHIFYFIPFQQKQADKRAKTRLSATPSQPKIRLSRCVRTQPRHLYRWERRPAEQRNARCNLLVSIEEFSISHEKSKSKQPLAY